MNKKYIIFLLTLPFLLVNSTNLLAQKVLEEQLMTFNAVVLDENNKALTDVKVSGREGATVVWTDLKGEFSISVSPSSELIIEKKGYFMQTIVASKLPGKVILKKSPFMMSDDQTINIAFGQIKKKEISSIIDFLNPEEMLPINGIHDYNEALSGRYFTRTFKEPLVIIDGFPRMPTGLSAEEIEQITVLKDINSAVLFGTQARNGVILIKTKRGEANKRRINISLEHSIDQPVILPKYLGSAQYMELYNEACANDDLPALYSNETIENYKSGNRYRYPDVDYYSNEYLRQFRPLSRLNAEFSGGNNSTQYYTNLGWTNTGRLYNLGTGKDASTNDLNIRANANVKINNFIKSNLDATVNFIFDKNPKGNFWNAAATYHPDYYTPLIPVSMLHEAVRSSLGASTKYIDGKYLLGGTTQYQDNVYGNMYRAGYTQNVNRLMTITNGLDFDLKGITEGLSFKTQIGIDLYNSFVQSVNNSYAIYQPTWATMDGNDVVTGLTTIGKDEAPGIQKIDDAYFYRQITSQAILDYNHIFNKIHSLNATVLGYYTKLRRDFFVVDDKASHIGLRMAYDYGKKVFIDFSSAYVHSIKLKKNNRNAYSPTLGIAWVMKESDSNTAVNYIKLKLTGGILNTDMSEDMGDRFLSPSTTDYDLSYRLYESNLQTSSSFGWNDGAWSNSSVIVSSYANPDLTFEKLKNLNIGLEANLFNKSLSIDANAFYIKNSGIVVQRDNLYSSMLANYIPYENYNENSYMGTELGLNWNKTISDFTVDFGANLIYRTSNIDKRDEIYQNKFQYRKGHPVSSIFGLKNEGFFNSESDIANSPVSMFGIVKPGDIKYKDQDNDGFISDNDMVYIGNYNSSFAYGLNFTVKYKGISLYALCDGQYGGHSTLSNNYYWVDANDKYSETVLNRWTETTAQTATFPRLTTKSSNNNYRISDFWLYDNSYFRINRLQFTYEFPRYFLTDWGVKNLSLYLRGSNLLMIGKDVDKIQLKIGSQPSYRQFAVGLRVSF